MGIEGVFDIEVHNTKDNNWAQCRYLVHGYGDVLWTDDLEEAIAFLQESCTQLETPKEEED